MHERLRAAWALMTAVLVCAPVEAATYDLWQAGSPSLATGSSYTAVFDTHLLFDTGKQRIDTATLTLNFVGAEQRKPNGSTSILTASGGGYSAYDYIDNYADELDRAVVLLEGSMAGAKSAGASSAEYQAEVVRSSQPVGYYQTDCYPITGCNSYYVQVGTNRFIDRVSGYKGSFSYVAQLDAAQLGQFNADGLYGYGFKVAGGGVQLVSAELVFNTSPVPEPQAATLAIIGLAALGGLLRRRSAGDAAVGGPEVQPCA